MEHTHDIFQVDAKRNWSLFSSMPANITMMLSGMTAICVAPGLPRQTWDPGIITFEH